MFSLWSISFKDPLLGGVHFMANENGLIALTWSRREIVFEDGSARLAYQQFDIESDDEPLEEDLFVRIFTSFQLELYRYIRRHRIAMFMPNSKLLHPSPR